LLQRLGRTRRCSHLQAGSDAVHETQPVATRQRRRVILLWLLPLAWVARDAWMCVSASRSAACRASVRACLGAWEEEAAFVGVHDLRVAPAMLLFERLFLDDSRVLSAPKNTCRRGVKTLRPVFEYSPTRSLRRDNSGEDGLVSLVTLHHNLTVYGLPAGSSARGLQRVDYARHCVVHIIANALGRAAGIRVVVAGLIQEVVAVGRPNSALAFTLVGISWTTSRQCWPDLTQLPHMQ
jgi:hypothetical protein